MTDDEPGGSEPGARETGGPTESEGTDAPDASDEADAPEVVLALPDDVREEFREPLGPVYADADALLAEAGDPVVAVGDVVTYHLERAGRTPDVAVVDWRTEREAVDDAVGAVVADLGDDPRRVTVENPPATLTAALLAALREAIDAAADEDDATGGVAGDAADGPVDRTTVVEVEGEEDLATLPAVLAAPDGASVVYGQPGEGMVLVGVDGATRVRVRELVGTLDGDHERARRLLGLGD